MSRRSYTMVRSMSVCLLLFVAAMGRSLAVQGTPTPAPVALLGFKTLPGGLMPLVSVTLNDGKPHLFICDPGTLNCILDANFVKSEKLTIGKLKVNADTEVDVVQPDQTTIEATPPLNIDKIPFGVEDLSALRSTAGPEVVGILGASFLRAFVERIDFSKKQIAFFEREDFPAPGKGAHRLPLQVGKGFSVQGDVDGNPTRFNMTFLFQYTLLQEPTLFSKITPVAKIQEVGAGGSIGNQTLRLKALRVEDVTWDSPVVDHVTSAAEKTNTLGMDFWGRFYITLDLNAKQLYLEQDLNYKEDVTKWQGTGFHAQAAPGGKLIISGVMTPSPASEAGLMAGDDILEIDGMPLATTPLATIFEARKRVAGSPMKLKIQRQVEEKPREFLVQTRKLL